MFDKTVSCGLTWDFPIAQSVDASQRWILSAMQRHGPELVTMLWRILGNEQDVCDAYQDTFLQLAHHEARQKPKHIKAYIFRTASNTAISMLRRRMAERRLSQAVAESKFATNPFESISADHRAGSPTDDLDAKQLQETLRYYITQLPENLRNVITLRDLAELTYDQVADILGLSAGTARVYRCKAIQLLAAWMSKEKKEI
ncbi:MAG TPA: sigma-70 family RNA polymerase sigma factor [Sedimentisphaerales bacterium]|nr:sigma-70 family RNA polymerase sigma factor [Sedimentisphaerales bacterium]